MSAENSLKQDAFPRSNGYDPDWVMGASMGPNPLWLMEWLTGDMPLKPGQRVLDLGCGTALTSIFLAKEFGVQVYAADLWVDPHENWERVCAAGVEDLVCPLKAEAHALPFAEGFFDAVVSIDAYQYFGTDRIYLGYLSRFVRPGGSIGVVVPGLMQPLVDGVPAHLTTPQANGAAFWEPDCACFMTREAWAALWEAMPSVALGVSDTLAVGWRYWRDYEVALEQSGLGAFPSMAETLERDEGNYLGFVRLIAERSAAPNGMNLYHPALKAMVGG